MNHMGLDVFLGTVLLKCGVSQDLFLLVLFVVSVVLLGLFMIFKGREEGKKESNIFLSFENLYSLLQTVHILTPLFYPSL
jgi:hypothetical protein